MVISNSQQQAGNEVLNLINFGNPSFYKIISIFFFHNKYSEISNFLNVSKVNIKW